MLSQLYVILFRTKRHEACKKILLQCLSKLSQFITLGLIRNQRARLKRFAERVIDEAVGRSHLVKGRSVVRVQLQAVKDAEHQVGVRHVSPAKGNENLLVRLFVNVRLGSVRLVAARGHNHAVKEVLRPVNLFRAVSVVDACNTRLDYVEERDADPVDLDNKVLELRDGVGHAHRLEGGPGRELDADALLADGVGDGLSDLDGKAVAVFDASAVAVGALVADVLNKLIEQVAICRVYFYTVKAGSTGVLCGLGKGLDCVFNILSGHFFGRGISFGSDGAGALDGEALCSGGVGRGCAPKGTDLAVHVAALGVDGIDNVSPGGDLLARVDARTIMHAAVHGRDGAGLGNDEGAGRAGTLEVVLLHERRGDVVDVGAKSGEGGHDDAVGDGDVPDGEGLEEERFGHLGRCGLFCIYSIVCYGGLLSKFS